MNANYRLFPNVVGIPELWIGVTVRMIFLHS